MVLDMQLVLFVVLHLLMLESMQELLSLLYLIVELWLQLEMVAMTQDLFVDQRLVVLNFVIE